MMASDERVGQSLDRAVNVTLDDDVELMEVAYGTAASDFLEGSALVGAQTEFALELLALVGYFACLLLCLHDIKCVACGGGTVKSEYEGRSCGARFLDALVALIEHGLYFSEMCTGKYYVAHMECAVLNKYVGYVAATLVERRLDD